MKKCLLYMVLVAVIFTGILSPISVMAETDGIFSYIELNNGIQITKCDSKVSGEVIIPEFINGMPVTWLSYWIFSDCENISKISLPKTIDYIDPLAFSGSYGITSFEVDAENEYFSSVDGILCNKEKDEIVRYPLGKLDVSFDVPDGIHSIAEEAFAQSVNLVNLKLPDSVYNIGKSAFSNCQKLYSVRLPDKLYTLNFETFYGCDNLTEVIMPTNIEIIESTVFGGCKSLKSISIPDGVVSVGSHCFGMCLSLEDCFIPKSVTELEYGIFENCESLTNISVDPENPAFSDVDGVLFNKDKTVLLTYPVGRADTIYKIPDGIKAIDSSIFCGDSVLEEIVIPPSVNEIHNGAFQRLSNLKKITVSEQNENYTSVDGVLFNKDMTILEAYPAGRPAEMYFVPDGVKEIGDSAFEFAYNLKCVVMPDSVIYVRASAFSDCENLKYVELSKNLLSIEKYAFGWCPSLENIFIPKTIESFEEDIFEGCDSFLSIYFAGNEEMWNKAVKKAEDNEPEKYTVYYNSKDLSTKAIKIFINGKRISMDTMPAIVNDRAMVPMRSIFEALGAQVSWDGEQKSITVIQDKTTITMQIGSTEMCVNGQKIALDSPPVIQNSRTLVPVRAISEAFGCEVLWDGETKTISITSLPS